MALPLPRPPAVSKALVLVICSARALTVALSPTLVKYSPAAPSAAFHCTAPREIFAGAVTMSLRTAMAAATRTSAECMPRSVSRVSGTPVSWVMTRLAPLSWAMRSRNPEPSGTTVAVTLVIELVIWVAMVLRLLPAAMESGLPVNRPVLSLNLSVAAVEVKVLAITFDS